MTQTQSQTEEDADVPVQRSESDFRPSPPQKFPAKLSPDIGDGSEEGISIDNIHFPTDPDIAQTESTSDHETIITTAARVSPRNTLESPMSSASPASSATEKASMSRGPSPVMAMHSRLVSFGKQHVVKESIHGERDVSQTAVVVHSKSVTGYSGDGANKNGSISSTESTPREQGGCPPPQSNDGSRVAVPRTYKERTQSPSPPTSLPSLPALPSLKISFFINGIR